MNCTNCAREGFTQMDGSVICCPSCAASNIHSAECNARTWPEWTAAKYLDDADVAEKLLIRLQKVLSLSHLLVNEMKEIQDAATRFVPNYQGSAVDCMCAHLQIDISYLEAEARKLLGS